MLFLTHLLFTALLLVLFRGVSPAGSGTLFAVTALLATLLPDLDSAGSILGRHAPWVQPLLRHRGVLHTPLAAAVLWLAARPFTTLADALLLGYVSHLLMDACSKEGILALFPLSRRRLTGPIRVGSAMEFLLGLGLAAAVLLML